MSARMLLAAGALAALLSPACFAAPAPAPEAPIDEPFLYELRTELGGKYGVWFLGAPCRKDPLYVCYAVLKGGQTPKEIGRLVLKKGRSRKAFRADFEKKLAALARKVRFNPSYLRPS